MTLRRIALLLAATVGTVILAYELRVHVFLGDHSFPELIELAPAHSTFIAYIDLAELRKEPLIGHLAALAMPVTVDPDYEQFRVLGNPHLRQLLRSSLSRCGQRITFGQVLSEKHSSISAFRHYG